MESNRTALVFGGTGLIGSYVIELLCADERYSSVRVFSRRELQPQCDKVEVVLTDFEALDGVADKIVGNDLFCCLGTTIRTAGSQEAQRKVDQQYPLDIAAIASRNGVHSYLFVSSLGARAKSRNFYLRLKGETEEALHKYSFAKRVLARPSALTGPRQEKRAGEKIGIAVLAVLKPFLLGKLRRFRSIHAKTVAQAMIAIANSREIKSIYESDALEALARSAQGE